LQSATRPRSICFGVSAGIILTRVCEQKIERRFIPMLIRGILVLTTLALVATAQQPQQPLTLQDCLRLAESVPNLVTVAEQERRIADRDLIQARAGFLPQSQVQNSFTYNSPSARDRSQPSFVALNGIREYLSYGQVTQEFDTSGRLRAEYQRARANQAIAQAEYEITRRDLRRSVATAYYRLLLTRQLAAMLRDALQESRAFEQRTKLLFENGEAAQADVVKASALAASLEQSQMAAEVEARLANQELASFWAKDVTEELVLADTFNEPPPPPEPDLAAGGVAAYLRRPEFNLFNAQRRGFEAEARRARSALFPEFNLVFQYGLDSTVLRLSERGHAAFFNLRIPVFDWFKARSQAQQFRLRAEQVETRRVIAERTFSRDYQQALIRARRLFDQIRLTQEQVRLAQEDLRLSRVRYEGGEGTALDVVTSQQQLAQARSNYYTALANYLNARADLEVASGR
jgi:outer membrane protein TolC